jgi:SAM-dependent methyltransferase
LKKTESNAWFKHWFNTQDYLDLYKHRDDTDASKIIKLLFKHITLKKNAEVLDLACGNGRHSVLFARKGFNVTGIDLSKYLISCANEKRKTDYYRYHKKLSFEIGDMRNIAHVKEFDLIVNIFSSFGYFENGKDNEKVIKSISRALKPNGYFLFDFLNKDFLLKNLVPYDIKKEKNKIIIQIRSITDGFVQKNILIIKNNPDETKYPVLNRYMEKIKLYSLDDFKSIYLRSGLKIIKIFGDYEGKNYIKNKSERLIILAGKI